MRIPLLLPVVSDRRPVVALLADDDPVVLTFPAVVLPVVDFPVVDLDPVVADPADP